jgi:hypothetical protein
MAHPSWQIAGDYFESCSCTYLCPCIPSNLTAPPTRGHCYFAFAFHVDRGQYGGLRLDGLSFAVVGYTPGVMAQGNASVGVVLDARASREQQEALTAIASGQAGGPMAALGPLITNFLGAEAKPIRFEKQGMTRSLSIPGVLEQAVEGVSSPAKAGEPLYIENTVHPANSRLALATAKHSRLHAFGLDWEDTTGRNNGHFASFTWQG